MRESDAHELLARIDELKLSYFERLCSIQDHVAVADRAAAHAELLSEIDTLLLAAEASHDHREAGALVAARRYVKDAI